MKLSKICPILPSWNTNTTEELLWKAIQSVQTQVEEQHRKTIWKHTRVSPYKLSREILDRMHLRLVVEPQHNKQWLEQKMPSQNKFERIGPVIITSLVL